MGGPPADVARAICGAQAQDAYAGRLAFRARSPTLVAADVDRARNEERSLVRTWAMRSTMHLLATDDCAWLVPLFERPMADNSRKRLGELGLEPAAQERGLKAIERALRSDGVLTRDALAERLRRERVVLDQSTRFHLFRLATVLGFACQGPDIGAQPSVALARDWIGERPPHDREAALRELARRYLRAFGPATEADFAGWAGLPLRDVRAGLEGVAGEIAELRIGDEPGWTLEGRASRPRGPIVRLLPAWDTYLIGHRDRAFLAQPDEWRRIMPGGGILRPAMLVDGVAVGTWRLRRTPKAVQVELDPFAELGADTSEAFEAEVADVGRFEGKPAATG